MKSSLLKKLRALVTRRRRSLKRFFFFFGPMVAAFRLELLDSPWECSYIFLEFSFWSVPRCQTSPRHCHFFSHVVTSLNRSFC
jgi:hypothetical protein